MKEKNIKVSIICLAYNHEKYIEKTLEGFVNQKTNFDFEIIINDDVSTDNTRKIIDKYVQAYPHLFRPVYQCENQYKKGDWALIDPLHEMAQGKYIAYCEGDDYWMDNKKLQKQYDILEKYTDCSICVHTVQCINEDESINPRIIPIINSNLKSGLHTNAEISKIFWTKFWALFQLSSYFIRKEVFYDMKKGLESWGKYLCGDNRIFLSALNCGNLWYLDEKMSCYRLNSIGSYTEKSANLERKKYISQWLKYNRGFYNYDKYTNNKFHKWILEYLANYYINLSFEDKNLAIEELKKINLKFNDMIKICSFKTKIKYISNKISPKLLSFLRNMKKH